jgi:hypothetical protein
MATRSISPTAVPLIRPRRGGYCDHFFVVTGGIGRFAGASGTGYIHGEGTFATKQAQFALEGTLLLEKR